MFLFEAEHIIFTYRINLNSFMFLSIMIQQFFDIFRDISCFFMSILTVLIDYVFIVQCFFYRLFIHFYELSYLSIYIYIYLFYG